MCDDLGRSINNLESIQFMVVDSSDIDLTLMLENDSGIVTQDASICSPVH